MTRREFLQRSAVVSAATTRLALNLPAQIAGERPPRADGVAVLNPRTRVPIGIIIDDSTCLVNLNRFAAPQFAHVLGPTSHHAQLRWREWPVEIPDSFLRKFGEWAATEGVKGKFSIVPYPACVGRLDRMLPGWTTTELEQSLGLVRSLLLPNWDIHPEMVTHTRVVDVATGHAYSEFTTKFMENWEWTTGRSVDEIAAYLAYALTILKNAGLPCEGITTPGGFGNRARPQLAEASFQSVRDVFGAEIPHYFRDLISEGDKSVAPLVQNVSGLDGPDPRCVVHTIGCTGDWTGGWDCIEPAGADKFITADGQRGRVVDIIRRGEPALMFGHWTGIYWNGRELGLQIWQEVVRRTGAHFDNLVWMKLSEVARYWAARELTRCDRTGNTVKLRAPFACPDFTLRVAARSKTPPNFRFGAETRTLTEVTGPLKLRSGTWCHDGDAVVVCVALPKGESVLGVS